MPARSSKKNPWAPRRTNSPDAPVLNESSCSIFSRGCRGESPKRIGPRATFFSSKNVIAAGVAYFKLAARSFQSVQKRGHVPAIVGRHFEIGHCVLRIHRLRVLQPPRHRVGSVRKLAGDRSAGGHMSERWADHAAWALHARDVVTRGAAILRHQRFSAWDTCGLLLFSGGEKVEHE